MRQLSARLAAQRKRPRTWSGGRKVAGIKTPTAGSTVWFQSWEEPEATAGQMTYPHPALAALSFSGLAMLAVNRFVDDVRAQAKIDSDEY
jgi:hypothetical protein